MPYDSWKQFMLAAAPEDMEGILYQAEECELGTASCCLFPDRDGKLKYQMEKIEYQQARIESLHAKIESLQAQVKTLEAQLVPVKKEAAGGAGGGAGGGGSGRPDMEYQRWLKYKEGLLFPP